MRTATVIKTVHPLILLLAAGSLLAACGNGEPGTSAAGSGQEAGKSTYPGEHTVKPSGPVQIDYTIIGTPVVGQPVAIELQLKSLLTSEPVTLSYQIGDSTALQLPEGQARQVSLAAIQKDAPDVQQVRVIPLREGRLYLDVSASVQTEQGRLTTVTAIPIEVGKQPQAPAPEAGVETRDASGEAVRVLQGN